MRISKVTTVTSVDITLTEIEVGYLLSIVQRDINMNGGRRNPAIDEFAHELVCALTR